MKPPPSRTAYIIMGRSSCDLPYPVLVFRTNLNLDLIPGLRIRLKQAMGGKAIRAHSPR